MEVSQVTDSFASFWIVILISLSKSAFLQSFSRIRIIKVQIISTEEDIFRSESDPFKEELKDKVD